MLGQPASTPYDMRFRLLGIPVRVHPLFWLIAALLGLGSSDREPIPLLIWVAVVFVSITVHEMGHAMAARNFGMHPEITLWGLGGLTSFSFQRFVPRQSILITLAGPFAGFAFAGLIAAILMITNYESQFLFWTIGRGESLVRMNWSVGLAVYFLLRVNILWGVINLFPVLPLDGGQITRDVLITVSPQGATERAYMISVGAGASLAAVSFILLQDTFLTFFFGYLAYMSYATLQSIRGGGFGSGRGW